MLLFDTVDIQIKKIKTNVHICAGLQIDFFLNLLKIDINKQVGMFAFSVKIIEL